MELGKNRGEMFSKQVIAYSKMLSLSKHSTPRNTEELLSYLQAVLFHLL